MTRLQLRALTPPFGTEVTGLDPEAALADDDTRRQLGSLFDSRGVLVFRDVEITQRQQAEIIRMLIGMGPLAPGEALTGRSDDEPFYVSNKHERGGAPFGRLLFHSDMMWSEHSFQVLSLYAVEVEAPVTPTMFVSAVDAWTTLPDQLRVRVGNLSAVQSHSERERLRAGDDPDVLISTFAHTQSRVTPIEYTHPRTGATVLYASQQMTDRIEGLAEADGEALLEELFAHIYRPEAVYSHEWRNGDLVAWDNIAVQHARPNVTLDGPARTLRKLFAPVPPRGASPAAPQFARAAERPSSPAPCP